MSVVHARGHYMLRAPVWFLDALQQLSDREGKPMNELVMSAMLEKYPELAEQKKQGFVSRILAKRQAVNPPETATIPQNP